MTRGFDYKKRKDWPARGARREWPPLNPEPQDPTLISNTIVGGTTASLQQTYVNIRASGVTVPSGVGTTVHSTDFVLDTWLSNDYAIGAWLDGTTDSFRFPRSGPFTAVVRVEWENETTGYRFVGFSAGAFETAAQDLASENLDMTVPNTGYAAGGDHGDVILLQNSGADRVATVHIFIAYMPSGAGFGGGSGGSSALRETYVSAITSGTQTITTGTLTTIATTAFQVGNLLSSDHAIGDWLDGTTNSVRFPKAGIATVQITVDWDSNTTGNRFTQYQSDGVSNIATNLESTAAEFVHGSLQVVTNQDLYTVGNHGLIQVWQDSGANRTCSCEFVIFYHPST